MSTTSHSSYKTKQITSPYKNRLNLPKIIYEIKYKIEKKKKKENLLYATFLNTITTATIAIIRAITPNIKPAYTRVVILEILESAVLI